MTAAAPPTPRTARDHMMALANRRGKQHGQTGGAVSKAFHQIIVRAGVGPVRFHDLRHTAATLMLAAGIHPKMVSERLGHATVAITLDIYSHVLPDLQRDAVLVMDSLLLRAGS